MGITQKNDIHKMIKLQAETNALSPIPEDEMYPQGAPLVDDSEQQDASSVDSASEHSASEASEETEEAAHLTEDDVAALIAALTDYIGPAAGILVEGTVERARDMDHLIQLLSNELFTEQDREDFSTKAYFLLSRN